MSGAPDSLLSDWSEIDPTSLPDHTRAGPFLVTNNPSARNAHGRPSHVWLVAMLHAENGDVVAFDGDRKVRGLTLYRETFTHQGDRHTAALTALCAELKAQHPGAFAEDSDSNLVVPSGVTPQTAYVKIDVSALAEVVIGKAVQS